MLTGWTNVPWGSFGGHLGFRHTRIAKVNKAINSERTIYQHSPFKLGEQNVMCLLGGTYENKSVKIKFIYILFVNIFFLFHETPVNKNIQVIEASGRGIWWAYLSNELYMVLLDLRHLNTCFCSIWGITNVSIVKVTFVMVSSCLTYMKWYCLCFYVTWFKSYGNY